MAKVDHPDYYQNQRYEVIEVIEDWKMGFHVGNTVKYCARAGRKHENADSKHKEIEDLEKAKWYLTRFYERRTIENPFDLTKAKYRVEDVLTDWNLNPFISNMIRCLVANDIEKAITFLNDYIHLRRNQLGL